MTATSTIRRSLFDLRSCLADDLADWYGAVIEHFDQTEWKRPGVGPVSLRRISVDARVYREARRRPIAEEQSSPRQSSPLPINTELARINEEPLRQNRPELVLWKDEIPLIRHAVILGAPGAGKSFLAAAMMVQTAFEELKKLSDRQIDLESANLSVFLKLEDLANAAASGPSEDTVIDLLRQYLPVTPALADWMKRRLFGRRCLWILDGLDQVGGEAGVKRVDDWLARIERSQCRAVVTCRTQSFTAQRAPGRSFVQYDLAPFESSGIRRFIEKWYGAGDARGGHLHSILRTNPSLEDSCRTPLVATLACLVNEDRNQPLPQNTRRVDLYEKIIRRFQDEEGRSGLDDIERDAEFLQMQRLAWNLFSAKPESNQFTGAELLAAAPERDVRQAAVWVKRLLKCRVLVKGGVGIADGSPQYSFIHRTVLEFLAAKYMAGIAEKQGWDDAEVEIAEKRAAVPLATVIDKKSWLPAWSATIVFLAGCLKRQAAQMIEMLWADPVDVAWHRRTLATNCIVELREEERSGIGTDRISEEFFHFLNDHHDQGTANLVDGFDICWRNLAEVNGHVNGMRLREILVRDFGFDRLPQVLAVTAPGLVDENISAIISFLLSRASGDPRRLAAARSLAMLGDRAARHAGLIPALLHLLDEIGMGPYLVADVLNGLGQEAALRNSADLVSMLLRLLRDGGRSWAWPAFVKALESLGYRDTLHSQVVPLMLARIEAVDRRAVDSLDAIRHLSSIETREIPQLIGALESPSGQVRARAAAALGNVRAGGVVQRDVILALIRTLRADNAGVRADAVTALGRFGVETSQHAEAMSALLDELRFGQNIVQVAVANAFVSIGVEASYNEGVCAALLSVLQGKDDRITAASELSTLRTMAVGQPAAVSQLSESLDQRWLWLVNATDRERLQEAAANAVGALWKKRTEGTAAFKVLVDSLHEGIQLVQTVMETIELLGLPKLHGIKEGAHQGLSAMLYGYQNALEQSVIATTRALAELADLTSSLVLIPIFLKILRGSAVGVRPGAASALASIFKVGVRVFDMPNQQICSVVQLGAIPIV